MDEKIKIPKPSKISKLIATIRGEGEYYRRFIEHTGGLIPASQQDHLIYMCRHRDGWKIKKKRVSYDLLRRYLGYLKK